MIRKYCLLLCSVIAVALFIAGIAFLNMRTIDTEASNYTASVQTSHTPNQDKPNTQAENIKSAVRTSYNVLLLIPDNSSSLTDVMINFNYNPSSGKISLLTIPRDTRVSINSSIPKINAAYSEGKIEKVYKVIDELLGFKPDYYVYIDIKGFRKIVDALGGVDFYIPIDIDYTDPTQDLSIHFKKGQQHLNGKKAEEFLRYRKTADNQYSKEMLKYYDGSDTRRTQMQVSFLKELIKQKANLVTLTKVNKILDITAKNVNTDMPLDVIFNLSKSILSLKDFEMNSFRITGKDTYINKTYYLVYNGKLMNTGSNEVLDAKDIISEYFSTYHEME